MVFVTIIIFIALLGVLILVHEWGHFFVARKSGIRVDEFGLGFPPKAYSVKKGGTEYSFNWIPLGGFVKIHGEDGDGAGEPDSFLSKSLPVRLAVVVAGVTMNFLFAILLLSFGFWYGIPQVVDGDTPVSMRDVRVTVLQVAAGSPADVAGLKTGDAVVKVSSGGEETSITDVGTLQSVIAAHKGESMTVSIRRGQDILQKIMIPRKEAPANEGPLGIVINKTGIMSYPWYLAPIEGVKAAFSLSGMFLSAFGAFAFGLLVHGKAMADIMGPVGIGTLTYQATQLGLSYFIQFAAVISLNLAIINALPFPALDGGRILFLLIEGIKGSPVSRRAEKIAHTTGFAVLISLMVFVTVHDISKFF